MWIDCILYYERRRVTVRSRVSVTCVTACLTLSVRPFTLVHGPNTRRGTTGYRRPVQNSEVFISAPGRVACAVINLSLTSRNTALNKRRAPRQSPPARAAFYRVWRSRRLPRRRRDVVAATTTTRSRRERGATGYRPGARRASGERQWISGLSRHSATPWLLDVQVT